MIKSQKFSAPPSFPPLSLSAAEREAYSLGIKLSCAFEILAASDSTWSERLNELYEAEQEHMIDDIQMQSWIENCEEPDGEEWMVLSTEDVRKMMAEDKGEEEQIKEMIANLEMFMEGESGFEGIDEEYISNSRTAYVRFEDLESDDEDDEELD
jgi:hypothetical protein